MQARVDAAFAQMADDGRFEGEGGVVAEPVYRTFASKQFGHHGFFRIGGYGQDGFAAKGFVEIGLPGEEDAGHRGLVGDQEVGFSVDEAGDGVLRAYAGDAEGDESGLGADGAIPAGKEVAGEDVAGGDADFVGVRGGGLQLQADVGEGGGDVFGGFEEDFAGGGEAGGLGALDEPT